MKKTLALMAAAGLMLSGCNSHAVAARVGDSTITTAQVDRIAKVECAISKSSSQPGSAEPMRLVRQTTLGRMIDLEVLKQVGKSHGGKYDAQEYTAQLQQLHQDLSRLPSAERTTGEAFFSRYIKGVLELTAAAADSLRRKGVQKADQKTLEAEMQRVYAATRSRLHIVVNPAYSPDDRGVPGAADGSLSVPVSGYAKQATSAQPDPAHVAELPRTMLCG